MKALPLFLTLSVLPLAAQNGASDETKIEVEEVPSNQTAIVGPISDGTPSLAIESTPSIPFTVLNSVTERVKVTEPSEIDGIPQVQGTINRTVQLVADPGLPDPPPLPLLPINDAAVQGRMVEARKKYKNTNILFVSARVLDFERTILKVYPNGQPEESVSVVSTIDFNDFSGFGVFNVAGKTNEESRQYALIMSIGNEITRNMKRSAARSGRTYQVPELPAIPADTMPRFVVLEGKNEEALQAIYDMHTLYAVEGARMASSRIAREKAHEERKAFLLANPPVPKDVTIRFWNRK